MVKNLFKNAISTNWFIVICNVKWHSGSCPKKKKKTNDSLKKREHSLIKDCITKISTLDEKLNASELFVDKIDNLEVKLVYLKSQKKLKSKNTNDLEQCRYGDFFRLHEVCI